ncbi:hypothetical protein [Marinicella litoralis]|uniref:Uncharacterized protein n=1 Tax=Marinicella litoralis TaxID=644220 RepID=A0A4R6XR45_9GAMM|nr:hypothetical protein [Marinicella litoralis]TDR22345.1 hypothetical protein C8D91_0833 [Marinicella litoralis]
MLLRRITQHVKDQNWFAVLIDFLIVVVGVFVGLQVQDFANERQRQKTETSYLKRLHAEVEHLSIQRANYDATREDFSKKLNSAMDILADPTSDVLISDDLCTAMVASAHTTVPPAALPTIDEMLSAGKLDQIFSESIRTDILNYTQQAKRAEHLVDAISDNNVEMARRYPEIITLHYNKHSDTVVDGIWIDPVCHAEKMRSDKAFMNDMINNSYMYQVYTLRAVVPVSESLAQLHQTLDEILQLYHHSTENN